MKAITVESILALNHIKGALVAYDTDRVAHAVSSEVGRIIKASPVEKQTANTKKSKGLIDLTLLTKAVANGNNSKEMTLFHIEKECLKFEASNPVFAGIALDLDGLELAPIKTWLEDFKVGSVSKTAAKKAAKAAIAATRAKGAAAKVTLPESRANVGNGHSEPVKA